MKKIFIILSMLFLIVSTMSAAGSGKTIIAAADAWPPFVDDKNPTDGLNLEIIRAAYKTQGYEVKMVYVPWARAELGVENGVYDILPDVWLTDKRKKYLFFSDSFAKNDLKFIKRKGDTFEFNTLKSLARKTVGTIVGYGYGNEFLKSNDFEKEEVTTLLQNIKKLLLNRIDLTLEDELVARTLIEKEDASLLSQIEFTKNSLSTNYMYVAAGLKNPRHKELINAFNKGLAEIKTNGTYNKIFEGYGIKLSNYSND